MLSSICHTFRQREGQIAFFPKTAGKRRVFLVRGVLFIYIKRIASFSDGEQGYNCLSYPYLEFGKYVKIGRKSRPKNKKICKV